MGNSEFARESHYLTAVCILAPVALLLFIFLILYALRRSKPRLNWYEHSLLEDRRESEEQTKHTDRASVSLKADDSRASSENNAAWDITAADGIDGPCCYRHSVSVSSAYGTDGSKLKRCGGNRESGSSGGGGSGVFARIFGGKRQKTKRVRFQPSSATPVVEVLKGLRKLAGRFRSIGSESDAAFDPGQQHTEWILCSRKRMGSTSSSPVHDSSEEKFWVPPAVVERKRAQSLVPTTGHDSEEEVSSGAVTPASLGGLREFTYTFQSTPVIASDDLPATFPKGHNRQRRASMQDAIDFRKIDSKLYDIRSLKPKHQSSMSIEEDPLGSMHFTLDFNSETCLLTVYLIEAENIVSRAFSGTADPYCKVCLLPDRPTQLQSKIHRKTTHPIFDEEFIFEVDPDTLHSLSLELLIYDYDQFSRHECIGEVVVPFENMDFNHRQTLWKPIAKSETKSESNNGDLIFSLGYLSSAERLTVVVMKARNLRHTENGKITMDPYVKVLLNTGAGRKVKKKKTSTQHNVSNPVWNEALTFNLSKDCLEHVTLEVLVYHDNKMGNDEILGKTRISRESRGDEKIHWDEMVMCKTAVARWHNLSV